MHRFAEKIKLLAATMNEVMTMAEQAPQCTVDNPNFKQMVESAQKLLGIPNPDIELTQENEEFWNDPEFIAAFDEINNAIARREQYRTKIAEGPSFSLGMTPDEVERSPQQNVMSDEFTTPTGPSTDTTPNLTQQTTTEELTTPAEQQENVDELYTVVTPYVDNALRTKRFLERMDDEIRQTEGLNLQDIELNKRFDILDNSSSDSPGNEKYGDVPTTLITMLAEYFHVKEDDAKSNLVKGLTPARLRMSWRDNNNKVDCGVFTMRHMETYMGKGTKGSDCGLEKENKEQLNNTRVKYLAEIVNSPINEFGGDCMKDARQFEKTSKAKKFTQAQSSSGNRARSEANSNSLSSGGRRKKKISDRDEPITSQSFHNAAMMLSETLVMVGDKLSKSIGTELTLQEKVQQLDKELIQIDGLSNEEYLMALIKLPDHKLEESEQPPSGSEPDVHREDDEEVAQPSAGSEPDGAAKFLGNLGSWQVACLTTLMPPKLFSTCPGLGKNATFTEEDVALTLGSPVELSEFRKELKEMKTPH
nr:uncharacterized protein LOC109184077 [Ipomoea batatas]